MNTLPGRGPSLAASLCGCVALPAALGKTQHAFSSFSNTISTAEFSFSDTNTFRLLSVTGSVCKGGCPEGPS